MGACKRFKFVSNASTCFSACHTADWWWSLAPVLQKRRSYVWCSSFVNRGEGRHETFWRHSLSLSGWVIHCSSPKWNTLTLAPSQPQEISMQQRTVQWLCWSNWEILLTWTCWGSSCFTCRNHHGMSCTCPCMLCISIQVQPLRLELLSTLRLSRVLVCHYMIHSWLNQLSNLHWLMSYLDFISIEFPSLLTSAKCIMLLS